MILSATEEDIRVRRDCANSDYLCKYVRLYWGLCGGLADAEDGGIADGAIASRCGATVFEGDFFGVLDFAGCATLETIGFHQTSLQKLGSVDISLSFRAKRGI